MNEKNEVFKKLLPIRDMFSLYQRLSETIITKIDLKGLNFDSIALNNVVTLLCEIGVIQFDNENSIFLKTLTEKLEFNDFSEMIYMRVRLSYPDAFLFFSQIDLKYDETEAEFYIKRNSVRLDLSGLLMLLDSIGKIHIHRNNIFIIDKDLLELRKYQNKDSFRHKMLDELKNQIEINEGYGVDAELAAMAHEVEKLKSLGINKQPERISEYYTNAGYDIVSFLSVDSLLPDKFIEVKSCSDNKWIFYISKNEMKSAKIKKDNYYLYLYNRSNKQFRIIQNPYKFFFESDEASQWARETQVYQFKSLEKLS